MARTRTMKLYHGTRFDRAEAILQSGFDLTRIKPRWLNDYAVSTLTSPIAVRRYMGDKPNLAVLGMTFRGNVANPVEAQNITEGTRSPLEYNRLIRAAGVDAVILDGSGARQLFVYNPNALSDIHLWAEKPPSARTVAQPHPRETPMTRTITAADRSALIRLASNLPVGSTERRTILSWFGEVTDRSVFDPDVNAQVSVRDVDGVLSDLLTGPMWNSAGVRRIEREALNLAKQGYGREVLMGILEWINNNEGESTPGMAEAYQAIAHIGRRIGRPIRPSDQAESGIIVSILNDAYMA